MIDKRNKTKIINKKQQITYCFVDASNLFYGGEKELGWSVDYKKLIEYLKWKFNVKVVYYFAGIDTHTFKYLTYTNQDFPIEKYVKFLDEIIEKEGKDLSEEEVLNVNKILQRAKFYQKLKEFGYKLKLKPVKIIKQEDGTIKKKANCDVDVPFYAMLHQREFDNFLLLSGDGDFEILLKYFKEKGKKVYILSNPKRTAYNIKKLANKEFYSFNALKNRLMYKKNERITPQDDLSPSSEDIVTQKI